MARAVARCTAFKNVAAWPKAAKEGGPGALPRKTFEKLEAKFCNLGTFGIVSNKIMRSRFALGGGATHNNTRSTWYAMAQVSDTCVHGTYDGPDFDQRTD